MVHVVVADDDRGMRQALVDVLDDAPDFHVVGEASTAEETVTVCRQTTPDLLLLDLRMPGTGDHACRQLRLDLPHMVIVVVSAHGDARTIDGALDAGAAGFLVKGRIGGELPALLTRALHGELVVTSDQLATALTHDPTLSSRSF